MDVFIFNKVINIQPPEKNQAAAASDAKAWPRRRLGFVVAWHGMVVEGINIHRVCIMVPVLGMEPQYTSTHRKIQSQNVFAKQNANLDQKGGFIVQTFV